MRFLLSKRKTLFLVIFLLSLSSFAYPRIVRFLPTQEEIQRVSTGNQSYTLTPVPCNQVDFQDYTDCLNCLDYQQRCPDCCLVDTSPAEPPREEDCTASADSDYDCRVKAFDCEDVTCVTDPSWPAGCEVTDTDGDGVIQEAEIPGCQIKGCPDDSYEPDPDEDQACIEYPSGSKTWYCTERNLIPTDRGCVPNSGALAAHYIDRYHSPSASVELFYETGTQGAPEINDQDPNYQEIKIALGNELGIEFNEEEDGEEEGGENEGQGQGQGQGQGNNPQTIDIYQYQVYPSYETYIAECKNYTNAEEACRKGIFCCKQNLCTSGYENNCAFFDQNNPGTTFCDRRLEWDADVGTISFNNQDFCCGALGTVDGTSCAANHITGGTCSALSANIFRSVPIQCVASFQEIDPALFYEFIPRSDEKFVFYWSIDQAIPSSNSDASFYTTVQIHQGSDPASDNQNNVVLPTNAMPGLHVKSFQGQFSIFSAYSVDSSQLVPGQTYRARLYYFIPQTTATDGLQMQVQNASITIYRARE